MTDATMTFKTRMVRRMDGRYDLIDDPTGEILLSDELYETCAKVQDALRHPDRPERTDAFVTATRLRVARMREDLRRRQAAQEQEVLVWLPSAQR